MSDLLFQESGAAPVGETTALDAGYVQALRTVAADGIVLLKNDGALPLSTEKIAVFGRAQIDYFYVGNGSGGDVKPPYKVNLLDGMKNAGLHFNPALAQAYAKFCQENVMPPAHWGAWPTHYPEMPLTESIVQTAKTETDCAIVIIGRCAGEDRDSRLEPGCFLLTDAEKNMLQLVTTTFDKTIIIVNSGNIMDFSWVEQYKMAALLCVWQGGMESGNAVADVLCGRVNPAGKLVATIARDYKDYPAANEFGSPDFNHYTEDIFVGYRYFETFAREKVLFPFGFGLSYTQFEMKTDAYEMADDGTISVTTTITNTGNYAGAEAVQVYYAAPQGVLGKPARALAGFGKTSLLAPGASETMTISFPAYRMASYDEAGATGNKSCYVLEAGEYELFAGNCVRSATKIGGIIIEALQICAQLSEAAAPVVPFQRMTARADGKLTPHMEAVPLRTVNLKARIEADMPREISPTDDKGYQLTDVAAGKISLEEFVAQLNIDELEGLTRGDYIMNSPLGVPGNAGVLGGVTESLRAKGVPPITTTDGPSGVRVNFHAALLPCGMAIASTWDTALVEQLAAFTGKEFSDLGSHMLLAPGMNIMRSPLCGRNFEYFSEDPILSGKVAAATVRGLQAHGKSACPKHFVANNQEFRRHHHDSRVSERALREIYLKGFEICVKESAPLNLMTAYNKINGVWAHYHYELCTTILRGEWGYAGNVVTDWWMQPCADPDFPALTNNAYRIRAQVDVLMPGGKVHFAPDGDGTLIASYEKENGITLAEIQRSAVNVLKYVLKMLPT